MQNQTLPTLSINGTGKDTLLEETKAARAQCIAFLQSLRASFPHARDYQGRHPEDYVAARQEREEMLRQVCAIRDQLDARLIGIYDGGYKRD